MIEILQILNLETDSENIKAFSTLLIAYVVPTLNIIKLCVKSCRRFSKDKIIDVSLIGSPSTKGYTGKP